MKLLHQAMPQRLLVQNEGFRHLYRTRGGLLHVEVPVLERPVIPEEAARVL